MYFLTHFNYWIVIVLMMLGFYIVIARGKLVKKLLGLNLFQTSVFILYISAGKVVDGAAPILTEGVDVYSNPLPHVLMLTAIVVGVATLGVGLATVQKLYKQYGTVEEDEILALIQKDPHQYDAVRPAGYESQNI